MAVAYVPTRPLQSGIPIETVTDTNLVVDIETFWKLADASQLHALYETDGLIDFLKEATLEEVKGSCLQYRYFVELYPDNLPLLISKMSSVQLKSVLSTILDEEIGEGEISQSHPW